MRRWFQFRSRRKRRVVRRPFFAKGGRHIFSVVFAPPLIEWQKKRHFFERSNCLLIFSISFFCVAPFSRKVRRPLKCLLPKLSKTAVKLNCKKCLKEALEKRCKNRFLDCFSQPNEGNTFSSNSPFPLFLTLREKRNNPYGSFFPVSQRRRRQKRSV